jgi:tRNA(Phe) wybutosine-synthesizing methylase Tyw3
MRGAIPQEAIHLHGIVLYIAQGNILHIVTAKFISAHPLSINTAYKTTILNAIPSKRL